jgi:ubiquinone/menaquinone biosynthesis C-methylase UbiE
MKPKAKISERPGPSPREAPCPLLSPSLSPKSFEIKRKISNYWNIRSSSYGSDMSPDEKEAWVVCLESLYGKKRGKRRLEVLDVGTGRGFLASILAEMGHDVTGVDLSCGMLKFAIEGCSFDGAPGFCLGDAERLPFSDQSFDLLVSRHLLWTLPHPEIALLEWKRVLSRGGTLAAIDGLWFEERARMRFRRRLSSLLTAIKERRDTTAFERHYSGIKGDLPLFSPESPESYLKLFQDSGLNGTRLQYLDEVDRAQRKKGGLSYSLNYGRPVFLVAGEKR